MIPGVIGVYQRSITQHCLRIDSYVMQELIYLLLYALIISLAQLDLQLAHLNEQRSKREGGGPTLIDGHSISPLYNC